MIKKSALIVLSFTIMLVFLFPIISKGQYVIAQTNPSNLTKVLVEDAVQALKSNDTDKALIRLNLAHQQLAELGNSNNSKLLIDNAIGALRNADTANALVELELALARNTLTDDTPEELKAELLSFQSPEWTKAFQWISENTSKDAIIASWWDYGYYIKTLGNHTSLTDNGTITQDPTRIATIAKMFIDQRDNGIKIAQDLKANYILIYLVAQRFSGVNGTSFYTLGAGGDESKKQWIMRIGGFDESNYLQQDGFTPTSHFWNGTLFGSLIPFTPKAYGFLQNRQITNLQPTYSPGSIALYVKDIKYPVGSNPGNQPLSLAYSSPIFASTEPGLVSLVLIYKVNASYVPKVTSNPLSLQSK
jgi:asparagine N-glycosylation enzyme membrane subunit Stt3